MIRNLLQAGVYIAAASSGLTDVTDDSVSDVIDSAAEATTEAAQEVNQFVQFVQDNIPNYNRFRDQGYPCSCFFLPRRKDNQVAQEDCAQVF